MSLLPKKIHRIFLALAVPTLLVACGILFYFTRPGVQRDIVLSTLRKQGVDASLAHASISFSGILLEDLTLPLPEARITCREVRLDISWLALRQDHLRILSSKLEGLDVDFSKKKPQIGSATPGEKTQASGGKPWHITLENASIENATIHLEDGRQYTLSADSKCVNLTKVSDLHFILTEKAPDGRNLEGTLTLHFSKPPARIPTHREELLAAKPVVSLKATLGAPSPATPKAVLSADIPTGEEKLRWTLLLPRSAQDMAPTRLTGEAAPDGTFSASLELRDFSTNTFAPLLGSLAFQFPELRTFSGTATASRNNKSEAVQARFILSGTATQLARAHKSLEGVGPLKASLAGTATLPNPDKPQSWKLALTRLGLRTTEDRALLDAAANINAAPGGQYGFGISAIVFANGLAGQPAWRELLAKFTADDWRGKLAATGTLTLTPQGEGTPKIQALRLSAASLAVARNATTKPILSLMLLRQFDSTHPLDSPDKPLLRASTEAFPLELATPFLGGARISGIASGMVTFWQNAGRTHLATEPGKALALHGVSFTDATGKVRLDRLHLRGEAKFTIEAPLEENSATPAAWQLDISKANADAGDGNPLNGSFSLAWCDGVQDIRAQLKGDPAHLLRQPLLGGFDNFASARLALNGSYTRDGKCDLHLDLKELTGRGDIGVLPSLVVKASGILSPEKITFTMPAHLQGRTHQSDLSLIVTGAGGNPWKATLDGTQIHAPDLHRLATIFTPSEAGNTDDERSREKEKEKPFWAWMNEGIISLALGKITLLEAQQPATPAGGTPKLLFEDDPSTTNRAIANEPPKVPPPLAITGTTATVGVRKDALTLHSSTSRIDDSTLGATGRLDFRKGQPEPYTLTGNTSVRAVPFRNWLERFKPEAANMIEGRLDATATLNATAERRKSILKNIELQALLKSRDGRVRVLKMDNDTMRTLGDLSDLAGGLADIVEGFSPNTKLTGKKAPLQAFRQVQGYLDDFPFEQAEVRLLRKRNGDIMLEYIRIHNEVLSMKGSGSIISQNGLGLADSPLSLSAGFSVRGPLADLLGELKILGEGKDAEGFHTGPAFQVGGTLNSLQTDLLATLLKAAQDSMLQTGDRIIPDARGTIKAGRGLLRDFGL